MRKERKKRKRKEKRNRFFVSMNNEKHRVFMFPNEATRCLSLLEKAEDSPILLQEILGNLSQHKLLTLKPAGTLIRCIKSKQCIEKKKYIQMLLSIYIVSPEHVQPLLLHSFLSPLPKDRFTLLLLTKAIISFFDYGKYIEIEEFVNEYLKIVFIGDEEIDYLFVQLLCVLARKNNLSSVQAYYVENIIHKNNSPAVAIQLVRLATFSTVKYILPATIVDNITVPLFLRLMDALSVLGTEKEKECVYYVTQNLPEIFKEMFRSFHTLKEFPIKENSQMNSEKIVYNLLTPIDKVKEICMYDCPAEEKIEKIKKILKLV